MEYALGGRLVETCDAAADVVGRCWICCEEPEDGSPQKAKATLLRCAGCGFSAHRRCYGEHFPPPLTTLADEGLNCGDDEQDEEAWFCEHRCECQQRRAANVAPDAALPSLPLPLYAICEDPCFLGTGTAPDGGSVSAAQSARSLTCIKTRGARPTRVPRKRRRVNPTPLLAAAAAAAAASSSSSSSSSSSPASGSAAVAVDSSELARAVEVEKQLRLRDCERAAAAHAALEAQLAKQTKRVTSAFRCCLLSPRFLRLSPPHPHPSLHELFSPSPQTTSSSCSRRLKRLKRCRRPQRRRSARSPRRRSEKASSPPRPRRQRVACGSYPGMRQRGAQSMSLASCTRRSSPRWSVSGASSAACTRISSRSGAASFAWSAPR